MAEEVEVLDDRPDVPLRAFLSVLELLEPLDAVGGELGSTYGRENFLSFLSFLCGPCGSTTAKDLERLLAQPSARPRQQR